MKDPVLLKSNQFAIPKVLRKRILDIAHQHHFGIVKTKWLMREKVWWQGMDQDVEHLLKVAIHQVTIQANIFVKF